MAGKPCMVVLIAAAALFGPCKCTMCTLEIPELYVGLILRRLSQLASQPDPAPLV